ncbi:Ig-like domain-containing protein, partial [Endozoicomonadaceae bacterium StTr2]
TAITKDNSGSVLTNDTDIDNNATKAVSKVTNPNGDTAVPGEAIRGSNGGRFTLHADGTYDFDPGNDFQDLQQGEQRTTEIEYTVTDEHGATSTAKLVITVGGVNDAPTANPLDNQTHNDSDTINLDLSGRFSDVDTSDTLTYSLANSSDALPQGLTLNADGTITGTIDRNASQVNGGQYSITVRASDGQGGHVDQTFSWTVNNPAPEARNNQAVVNEGNPGQVSETSGNVITDSDGQDSDPDGDTLTLTDSGVRSGEYGQLILNSDGSYRYILNNNDPRVASLGQGQTLTETFSYSISDGNGGVATASLTVTVQGVNDPVVATDNSGAVREDINTETAGNVITDDNGSGVDSDTDQNDQLTVIGIGGQTGNTGQVVQGEYGQLIINADGSYRYILDNSSGKVQALGSTQYAQDIFTYTVSDGKGSTATATLVINVQGLDEANIPVEPEPDTLPINRPHIPDSQTGDSGSAPPLFQLPVTGDTDDLFAGILGDPRINPVRLTVQLKDRVLTEDITVFSLPVDAFEHSEPFHPIRMEATLPDGSPLPDYIYFNASEGTFSVDVADALHQGVESVDIRIAGKDLQGNEAASTFNLTFAETVQDQGDLQLAESPEDQSEPETDATPAGVTTSQAETEAESTETDQRSAMNGNESFAEQLAKVSGNNFAKQRDDLLSALLDTTSIHKS